MPTATSARSSRSRSSSRCEISAPSGSFSGAWLIGAPRLRRPSGGRVGAGGVGSVGLGEWGVGAPVLRHVRRRGGVGRGGQLPSRRPLSHAVCGGGGEGLAAAATGSTGGGEAARCA